MHLSVGGCIFLIRTDVRRVSPLSTVVQGSSWRKMSIALNPSLAPRSSATPIRLTKRGRALARWAAVTSLSILLISVGSAISGASTGGEHQSTSPYLQVSVKPGETLWSIASMIAGDGDRRAVVAEIMEVNHLKSPDLYAGQRIFLPTR